MLFTAYELYQRSTQIGIFVPNLHIIEVHQAIELVAREGASELILMIFRRSTLGDGDASLISRVSMSTYPCHRQSPCVSNRSLLSMCNANRTSGNSDTVAKEMPTVVVGYRNIADQSRNRITCTR